MDENDAIRDAIREYRSKFQSVARVTEAQVMEWFPVLIEKAGFRGLQRWWRHWDLYWFPHSGFNLVGEVKGPGSPEFNPDLQHPRKQGYVLTSAPGEPQSNQGGDGVAQLHLYCMELRVRFGLFTDGQRLLVYEHAEIFTERCLSESGQKCCFPRSVRCDANLLRDEIGLVVGALTKVRELAGGN